MSKFVPLSVNNIMKGETFVFQQSQFPSFPFLSVIFLRFLFSFFQQIFFGCFSSVNIFFSPTLISSVKRHQVVSRSRDVKRHQVVSISTPTLISSKKRWPNFSVDEPNSFFPQWRTEGDCLRPTTNCLPGQRQLRQGTLRASVSTASSY